MPLWWSRAPRNSNVFRDTHPGLPLLGMNCPCGLASCVSQCTGGDRHRWYLFRKCKVILASCSAEEGQPSAKEKNLTVCSPPEPVRLVRGCASGIWTSCCHAVSLDSWVSLQLMELGNWLLVQSGRAQDRLGPGVPNASDQL